MLGLGYGSDEEEWAMNGGQVQIRRPSTPASTRALCSVAILVVMFGCLAARASATLNSFPERAYVTDGSVNAIAVGQDGTTYIGGQFSGVGPWTGSGVGIGTVSGQSTGLPEVVGGPVQAVQPDGHGGWYIGGAFTHVTGIPRTGLAHILPDGSVDP